jgi:hypothetical protein
MAEQFGVITEQNDLCLNFMPINEKDRAVVEKVIIKDENGGVTKSTQVINEDKK